MQSVDAYFITRTEPLSWMERSELIFPIYRKVKGNLKLFMVDASCLELTTHLMHISVHTHVDGHQFSTGSPRAATAGGRTRTRQSTGFRGLHRLVHGCIARLSRGAHEEARRAAVKESAAALKRGAHGVELRQRTQAKHPGECLTAGPQGIENNPSFRDQIGSELSGPTSVGPGCKWIEGRPSWNQRGRCAHVLPTKSNLVSWNHRQQKHSPRETDDKIGLTEHLQSRSRGFHGVGVSRGIHIPARQEAPLGCSVESSGWVENGPVQDPGNPP
ncbi:hypothetical protein PGT21_008324 [Puccinia graminis f. sp. tritici]|uniref:Uncharacterized protein n=1 Tax=Puccinia graminis f. sp. tritici TaxID=56615 RepID=A0A5B0QAB2_PUCGR|nr:hypothetical protein PGT21_008324 [Puccinia graminis f. sp. tritici]